MTLSALFFLLAAAPPVIHPGELWPDDRGRHIQAHGGGIIKLGDTYYWFGEDRCAGTRPRQTLRQLLLLEGPGPLDVPQPGHQTRRPGEPRPAAGCSSAPRSSTTPRRRSTSCTCTSTDRAGRVQARPRRRRHLRHRRWRLPIPEELPPARPGEPRHRPVHRRRRLGLPDLRGPPGQGLSHRQALGRLPDRREGRLPDQRAAGRRRGRPLQRPVLRDRLGARPAGSPIPTSTPRPPPSKVPGPSSRTSLRPRRTPTARSPRCW